MNKKARIRAAVSSLEQFYKKSGRHTLAWRKTHDPYKILVSEVMLQQTQVSRVLPFYERFIKEFPTAESLSRAPLKKVLTLWNGLGYNRRAKYLRDAAKILAKEGYTGQKLPGVGPYTKAALSTFAYNKPEVFVETNIRTVFLHFYFPRKKKVKDEEIVPLIREALTETRLSPRDFYYALMDYGSFLKGQGIKTNNRSAHYVIQSKFAGSPRELRGAILRELIKHHATLSVLLAHIPKSKEEVTRELARLTAEGLVKLHGRFFEISK